MTQRERSHRWYVSKGKVYQQRKNKRLKKLGLCANCGHRKGRLYCKLCTEKINTRRRLRYHCAGQGMKERNRFLYGKDAAEHMIAQLKKQCNRCAICRTPLVKPFQ